MGETEARRTPLFPAHEDLGAKIVEFAGWRMPLWYGGATAEHHAVRRAAGLFDLSHMAQLVVSGPAAGSALEWALLVAADAMPVGRARYTMLCAEDGGIVDDLVVYRLEPQTFLVVANAANAETVLGALASRCESFAADVTDRTEEFALIAVQGPAAAALVVGLAGETVADLAYYRAAEIPLLGARALVARTGYTGEDGFEIFLPRDVARTLWDELLRRGRPAGLLPVGLAARDTLRIEAGMPLYSHEITRGTTPFDVGARRLVADRVSGFVGAEALAEAARRPHEELVGLAVSGRRPARGGYGVSSGGSRIGAVTSGTVSPTLGHPIAIARVTGALAAGEQVEVDLRGTAVPATVVPLPFYRRRG